MSDLEKRFKRYSQTDQRVPAMQATARAHSNIALIKYWGKRDEERVLPYNNSLSVTLDQLYSETTVRFNPDLQSDVFILNGQPGTEHDQMKVTNFLNHIRDLANVNDYAVVTSNNHVPTAQGLASSASGFAALATAAATALNLGLNAQQLSRIARQGSGSACRSIYDGFVEWVKGERTDGHDSYAVPIAGQNHWDIRLLIAVVSSRQKSVSSRDGMRRTVKTSVFYSSWLATVEKDLDEMRRAIASCKFEDLGLIAEANALKMHATTLGADPPFCYWNEATLTVMNQVRELRASGIPAYFTIDAGPNVVVLCEPSFTPVIQELLLRLRSVQKVIECRPGPGVTVVRGEH